MVYSRISHWKSCALSLNHYVHCILVSTDGLIIRYELVGKQ